MRRTAVAVGLLGLTLGAGFDCVLSERDKQPDDPLTVDWREGSYDGVALRSSTAALIARVGRPERSGTDEPIEPIRERLLVAESVEGWGPCHNPTRANRAQSR